VPASSGGAAPTFHTPLIGCPIEACLGALGKKWTLVLLRDVAFFGRHRFGDFLRANEGLTPRVLSRRLKEMVADGLLDRAGDGGVSYTLTEKGRDAVPVLSALFQFGARHNPRQVFPDGRPRSLGQVFPAQQGFILGSLQEYALEGRRRPAP
jgi:DNA-binding HxlR family transcriptional regulator